MFVNNTFRNSSFIEKKQKTSRWISLNLYSNLAHNFVKHLVACLGRHGAYADPAIAQHWARSLLQLPETLARVTS